MSAGVGGQVSREQALARLLTRISSHADFPSLKESISSIQQIVRSEQAHMRALTEGVLKDVALTTKLLRLINSACYRAVGAGSISSVQRALRIGYNTAARHIDRMEEDGIVTAPNHLGRREVLIDRNGKRAKGHPRGDDDDGGFA